jgi:hypothetical protein
MGGGGWGSPSITPLQCYWLGGRPGGGSARESGPVLRPEAPARGQAPGSAPTTTPTAVTRAATGQCPALPASRWRGRRRGRRGTLYARCCASGITFFIIIFIFKLLGKFPVQPCIYRTRSQNTAVNLKKPYTKHCSFLRARADITGQK